jgi:hypothetical protein
VELRSLESRPGIKEPHLDTVDTTAKVPNTRHTVLPKLPKVYISSTFLRSDNCARKDALPSKENCLHLTEMFTCEAKSPRLVVFNLGQAKTS